MTHKVPAGVPPCYARVVVDVAPAHLDRPFDYVIPGGLEVGVGHRVRVVFGGRRRPGWVVALGDSTDTDADKLRSVAAVEGEDPWFDPEDLDLFRWVARRYSATLADVLRHALPGRVAAVEREGAPAGDGVVSPESAALAWEGYDVAPLHEAVASTAAGAAPPAFWLRPLPGDDPGDLIEDLVRRCLAGGRSAVVLGPDPASPGPGRALKAAGTAGADLRTDNVRARYRAFRRCRSGVARVAVGERSGVFAPVRDLGLVIVDDEANPAYKERRSPRHHVREVALARARMAGAVCVLLADLPSANLWRLVQAGHVTAVPVDRSLERSRAPRVDVVDLADPRPGARRTRFGDAAAKILTATVAGKGAAVVLASRGGQGAALLCRGCRRRLACPVCAGSLAVDRAGDGWHCPSCSWAGAAFACPDCGDDRWAPLAAGAGRLATELRRSYPSADVERMEGFDAPGPRGRPAVAVMTRGSVIDRPHWLRGGPADAVIVPDADALLQRASFDAAEDALRLWFATARWTSRVVLQTREPGHHAVQALVRWDPSGFWDAEAPRRAELRLPPSSSLVRIQSPDGPTAAEVAAQVRSAVPSGDEVLGPDLGNALLVKSADLRGTLAGLIAVREDWAKRDRKVRVDVDPLL